MKTLIPLFLLLVSGLSWGIPEVDYQKRFETELLPYFKNFTHKVFLGKDQKKVHYYYSVSPENKKTLVISPGRTEPSAKYAEVVYDLKDSGFNIFLIDHRGQGESERMVSDSHKGYVRDFQDYVDDFSTFMKIVKDTVDHPLYLLAHSMGGAIATYYINENPEVFTKAAFSAPMFEVNTKPYSEKVATLLSKVLVLAGQGKKYAPDRGPYIPAEDRFEINEYTHSEARFEMTKYLYVTYPELTVGGPTSRWVYESLKATKKIDTFKNIPSLLFQATEDTTVKPGRQNSYCHTNCELIVVKGAYHEILMEKDAIRDPVMKKIRSFFGLDLVPENR